MIINDRGKCVCPTEFGYRLDAYGNCTLRIGPECETDNDCPDSKYCNLDVKKCDNPCILKKCGKNAFCNATNHQGVCFCIATYTGDAEVECRKKFFFALNWKNFNKKIVVFSVPVPGVPRVEVTNADVKVSCLSDGIEVDVHIEEKETFNGLLYVKGHSKDELCRRIISVSGNTTTVFRVNFGNCGLIHVNVCIIIIFFQNILLLIDNCF